MRYLTCLGTSLSGQPPVASFTFRKLTPRLAKRPLKTNGRLVKFDLTSLVKEGTARQPLQRRM